MTPRTAPPPGRTVPGNRWDLLDGVWPDPPPTVTVVVTHYEQPRQLERTLAALGRQTHPADRVQVVVVDDGSAAAPSVPGGVELLRQPDLGFRAGAARNLGASAATGDVLCFLDADTAPEPGYLAQATRLPALAPESVVVGRREHARLAGTDPHAPVELAGPRHRLDAPAWLADGYAASSALLDADDRSYRFVISAVLTCSRWLFEEVGGFDESMTSYGGEDWDWARRAWQQGAILAHEPRAVAWHDGPDWSGRTVGADRRRTKNVETVALLTRHGPPGARPRALRLAPADVEVHLPVEAPPEALLLVADAVLEALPHARLRVPEAAGWLGARDDRVLLLGDPPTGEHVRVLVELTSVVRPDPADLRAALALLDAGRTGTVHLHDAAGRALGRARSTRAVRRETRWGRDDLFERRTAVVRAVDVPDVPDLEAYVGGWG